MMLSNANLKDGLIYERVLNKEFPLKLLISFKIEEFLTDNEHIPSKNRNFKFAFRNSLLSDRIVVSGSLPLNGELFKE